jgi:DNA-binding LacI/PurR family transcriptional regulator
METPHVIVADHHGAALGFDHLWQLGHRRIAVVHGDVERSTTVDRVAGVRDAARRHGAVFDDTLLVDAGRLGERGETALAALLQRAARPTAVLALSNSALLAAIRALHHSRLRCPDEISLVGFGVTGPYWIPSAAITMVEQPVGEMAIAAVQLLLNQLARERAVSVTLPASLAVGQSSGPASGIIARRKRRVDSAA